jgi:hypothetical protein
LIHSRESIPKHILLTYFGIEALDGFQVYSLILESKH